MQYSSTNDLGKRRQPLRESRPTAVPPATSWYDSANSFAADYSSSRQLPPRHVVIEVVPGEDNMGVFLGPRVWRVISRVCNWTNQAGETFKFDFLDNQNDR